MTSLAWQYLYSGEWIAAFLAPFVELLGGYFFLILFAGFFVALWVKTRTVIVPGVVGIFASGVLFAVLPPEAHRVVVVCMVMSIASTLVGVFVRR